MFVNTGLEYPEVQIFAMNSPNVNVVYPKMRFDQVIREKGYPIISKEVAATIEGARNGGKSSIQKINGVDKYGNPTKFRERFVRYQKYVDCPVKVSASCCYIMKKAPANKYMKQTGQVPFVGTMAEESFTRQSQWQKHGCNVFSSGKTSYHPVSKPLSFWTENDILEFLYINHDEMLCVMKDHLISVGKVDLANTIKHPWASVYGDIILADKGKYKTTGLNRTGCMFCAFGIRQDGRPNRFESMKETHPKQYEFCMKPLDQGGLGMDFVLTYFEIPH